MITSRLPDFRDRHAGETIVVCGCGRSLAELPEPGRLLTIGVNDVGRLFDPTYLVVVNPKGQFRGDRFRHVESSRAAALFTQLDPRRDLGIAHPQVVRFRLGRRGGTDLDDPDTLPYTRNSPYVAACLAAYLGARRIGLIGVDFTDHHFFAATGTHPLARELAQIDREYGALAAALARRGVELVNLSRESRLAALSKAAPGVFLKGTNGGGNGRNGTNSTSGTSDAAPANGGEPPRTQSDAAPANGGEPPRTQSDVIPSAAEGSGRGEPGPRLPPPRFLGCARNDKGRGLPAKPTALETPAAAPAAAPGAAPAAPPRVFFVHYQFLSCGDVFTRGLEHAAADLGLAWEGAPWNDPRLPEKVAAFRPDLLFVVHGRQFRRRWGDRFRGVRSAVWLLDEPYEVDDTERTSRGFDVVFVNDPVTLGRHGNAHYLPAAWDPHRHADGDGGAERRYQAGFIGGGNPTREATLLGLAREGLLSYVVGGPWRARELRALSLGTNVPPERTAALYRETQLVVNVFRDRHHYNRLRLPATSLNPRVYEALACGALVVSEDRPELDQVFPELPRFTDAPGLAAAVRGLLADSGRRRDLLAACRARLATHTYAERLRAALAAALPGRAVAAPVAAPPPESTRNLPLPAATRSARPPCRASSQAVAAQPTPASTDRSAAMPDAPPTYAILMAVHNALEMTRLSVLTTLRRSAGAGARLVVVDNASTDGTREWLRLMARRGDLDLLESPTNQGHGPALELARAHSRSPYLVTLDSDAFPLVDDWLARLRAHLDGGAAVAGIVHPRGHVHPSCLMIARATLDRLGVGFLDDWRRRRIDVGERISLEVRRRGGRLAGLERTRARRRATPAEEAYLGAEYGGIVYHQWYTTRAVLAGGAGVDTVPREAIEESLAEVLEEGRREPRDLTVVVACGAPPGEEARRRNALAVLTALNFQDLPRWRYRIVAVEQGAEPQLEAAVAPLADRYVFAWNPGPYNRSWGRNVGAVLAGPEAGPLAFLDADLLVPPDFLRRGLAAMSAEGAGTPALLPYREVVFLDAGASARAIAERLADPTAWPAPQRLRGRTFRASPGGSLWLDAALYHAIGGHDERFTGWGFEDTEILERLERAGHPAQRLDGCLLHLDHPRPPESDALARANRELYQRLARQRGAAPAAGPIGDPRRFAREAEEATRAAETPDTTEGAAPAPAGRRNWEHWHRWGRERIERIVDDEGRIPPAASARRAVADLAVRLGESLLDVGCGPGATWRYFLPHRPRFTWAGADVTAEMVAAARRLYPGVPVAHADAGNLPWGDGSFDVVLLRDVLELLPRRLFERALAEAMRVARRAVVLSFHLPPLPGGAARSERIGEGFLETRWTAADVAAPAAAAGWTVRARQPLLPGAAPDEAWVLAPASLDGDLDLAPPPAPPAGEPWKFSIVMPTYRRPHRLAATVETVLAQSYRNWELILVDNAGDAQPVTTDPRVLLVRHAERPSAAWARNQGLRYATGDFVCFFDDDDDMFPGYLASFAAVFRSNPRIKMARCGMVVGPQRVNYSFATPEVCLKREHATPTWRPGDVQDQVYFKEIVARNRWSERRDVAVIRAPLCRANGDPAGGRRAGST